MGFERGCAGLGEFCGVVTWAPKSNLDLAIGLAFARRTRFSPGYHVAGFPPTFDYGAASQPFGDDRRIGGWKAQKANSRWQKFENPARMTMRRKR